MDIELIREITDYIDLRHELPSTISGHDDGEVQKEIASLEKLGVLIQGSAKQYTEKQMRFSTKSIGVDNGSVAVSGQPKRVPFYWINNDKLRKYFGES